jgi:hypothetical protein
MTYVTFVPLSGTSHDVANNFVRQLNDDIDTRGVPHRLLCYTEMCKWTLERKVTFTMSSSFRCSHDQTYSTMFAPLEDLPSVVEEQCRRDGVLITTPSVSSALAEAGLPPDDFTVVSIGVMTHRVTGSEK